MDNVEIIELHHNKKVDAPSGTALKTAELINKNKKIGLTKYGDRDEIEKLESVRGGEKNGIHIHSVRLPGLVAHQEVIFGAEGQSLNIRHDSYDRSSFMPGVSLGIDKIEGIDGFVYGLEHIME
jgi:4-hydroxy-tetrahydrodipicolinate reductase